MRIHNKLQEESENANINDLPVKSHIKIYPSRKWIHYFSSFSFIIRFENKLIVVVFSPQKKDWNWRLQPSREKLMSPFQPVGLQVKNAHNAHIHSKFVYYSITSILFVRIFVWLVYALVYTNIYIHYTTYPSFTTNKQAKTS